jgi:hypothetical protein
MTSMQIVGEPEDIGAAPIESQYLELYGEL